MRACLTLIIALSVGCKSPLEAPEDLQELNQWMFENWEDPEAMASGAANLLEFARGADLQGGWEDRSYTGGGFPRGAVDGLVEHQLDPQEAVSVSLFFSSSYRAHEHLEHIGLADQTPVEPSSPNHYQREFIENDADCVADGGCDLARSMNDVERNSLLYDLSYVMRKDWRWVTIEDVGDALCARSFNLDSVSDGGIELLQGYSIDLFLPSAGGSTRYQTAWQQSDAGIDDEDMVGAIARGIEDQLSVMDDWLAGR